MKHKEFRAILTEMFGSCPLTDEFIDNKYETCYYAIDAECACQQHMRDELGMRYTDEYVAILKEAGIDDPYQKVNLNFNSGKDLPEDMV